MGIELIEEFGSDRCLFSPLVNPLLGAVYFFRSKSKLDLVNEQENPDQTILFSWGKPLCVLRFLSRIFCSMTPGNVSISISISIYIYVCVYIYMYIYIYTHIHNYIYKMYRHIYIYNMYTVWIHIIYINIYYIYTMCVWEGSVFSDRQLPGFSSRRSAWWSTPKPTTSVWWSESVVECLAQNPELGLGMCFFWGEHGGIKVWCHIFDVFHSYPM